MSNADNSVRIQAERFADKTLAEIDSSFPGLSGIKERLVANATKSLEEMAILLVKKGFPDIRVDETNWAVIAAKVNAEPNATVGEIFQAALIHHRKESAAKTKIFVEEHVERLSKQINVVEAFLDGGDWYVELAKRKIGNAEIYWRFLNKLCEKVTRVVVDNVAVAVFKWMKSSDEYRIDHWPELYGLIKVQSQKNPWLIRYHEEYDTLPRLEIYPESERFAEFHRREAIRRDLLSLPDAPKTIVLSAVERIKDQFRTYLGVASICKNPFQDRERLNDWIESDFDQGTVPDFDDPALNLLSNDLRIAMTRECIESVDASRVKIAQSRNAPLNTKERQEQLVKTGEKLISKKKYPSKSALAKAMDCDCRAVAFKAVWKLHEAKHGLKIPTPKVSGADAANYASVESNQDELDCLIEEQTKDKISESSHRKGRGRGSRKV